MQIKGWPKGINNVATPADIPADALRDGLNIDITRDGKPSRRPGRVKRYSGTGVHSFFSYKDLAVFVEGLELKELLPDYTARVIRSDMHLNAHVSYTVANNAIYYSNNYQTGVLDQFGVDSALGIPQATGQPSLSRLTTGEVIPAGAWVDTDSGDYIVDTDSGQYIDMST